MMMSRSDTVIKAQIVTVASAALSTNLLCLKCKSVVRSFDACAVSTAIGYSSIPILPLEIRQIKNWAKIFTRIVIPKSVKPT